MGSQPQARRAAPAAVKAGMVAFCNRCLAEGCARAKVSAQHPKPETRSPNKVSRAEYLSADHVDHAVARSKVALFSYIFILYIYIYIYICVCVCVSSHSLDPPQAASQMQGIVEDALTAALAPLGGRPDMLPRHTRLLPRCFLDTPV